MLNGEYIMMIELLDKSTLALLNKKIHYPLAITEKDYFLALVLKIIYASPLKNKLIFKGGTALHHVYLSQLRFSEDLDFSTNHTSITLEEVKKIFYDYDFLTIKKDFVSDATIKIERLLYNGPLGQSNSLKIEIDFLQNVVLPPIEMDYKNIYNVKTKVKVMDIREITAEKIRAMNERIRYRDFYDFSMICVKLNINITEIIYILKQKEIRKNILPKNIFNNWNLAKKEKTNEFASIYYSEELSDTTIEMQLKKLQFDEISKTIN